jgi:putative Ca2+/H+ antiporter (TMEM165/GDT1 family)
LALLLAARFRVIWPILAGILVATVANHSIAAWLGSVVAQWLSGGTLRWVIGISFIAMGAWMLVPDKMDGEPRLFEKFGAFGATAISFFVIEIGNKTQFATMAMGARFHDVFAVAAGTTLGMMIADAPVVVLGDLASGKLPLGLIRYCAAAIFIVLGVITIINP